MITIWRTGGRRWLAIAAAAATILLWIVPMTVASGGVREYLTAFQHLWSTVPGRRTTLSSPWLAVARIVTIGWIAVLCLGFSSAFVFWRGESVALRNSERSRFVWLWVAPGLFFFTFVFFNYINSGYLLVLCPPAFALAAARVHGFLKSTGHRNLRRLTIAGGSSPTALSSGSRRFIVPI